MSEYEENVTALLDEILSAVSSEDSFLGRSLLDLMDKAGTTLVYVQHIL